MSVETVARRYSSALADVVIKSGGTEIVRDELKIWQKMLGGNESLAQVFGNPSINQESKEKILNELIKKANPSKTTANFLQILLKNGRLSELGEINERFDQVLDERNGIVSANVISARPLGEAEKSELQKSLAKMTGKQVKLNYNTDENIIGGVVTRIGSVVYDGSVKTQLENLRQQMIGS
ncbi:MAG TPA: ATP synthase F1 subunit delta [Pyrinomonadaceae bacterium]|nr:ATP synthase F1 subunit delta [Pyrinomonadaceae bacterium]